MKATHRAAADFCKMGATLQSPRRPCLPIDTVITFSVTRSHFDSMALMLSQVTLSMREGGAEGGRASGCVGKPFAV